MESRIVILSFRCLLPLPWLLSFTIAAIGSDPAVEPLAKADGRRDLRIHDPAPPMQDAAGDWWIIGTGRLVAQTSGSFIGPGHIGLFQADGIEMASMHFYDGTRDGRPTLAIRRVEWTGDGWPELAPE